MASMREMTNLTTLGLSEEDNRVLQTIMKIVVGVHHNFQLVQTGSLSDADIVFVNEGDSVAFSQLSRLGSHVIPIVFTTGNPVNSSLIAVRRPIVLKRVLQAIETASSSRYETRTANLKASSRNHMDSKNILIVDDSFPVRKFMELKLQQLSEGHSRLFFSENGKEAVEQIRSTQFDAVFLDVVMPDINGYKICKWIKSVQPNCKVVMLTGKKSTIDRVRGSMSGCDAYLTKPPTDVQLAGIYQELIAVPVMKQAIA
jgi:two-component system, cell cycle response regulator